MTIQVTEEIGNIVTDDDPAIFLDWAKWYHHPMVLRGFGSMVSGGRFPSLRHVGRDDRQFSAIGTYSPAAPGVDDVSAREVMLFENGGGLAKGYLGRVDDFRAAGAVSRIVIGFVFKSTIVSASPTQVLFNATGANATLLGVQTSGDAMAVAHRGLGTESQNNQVSGNESGKTNWWNAVLVDANYAARTVECSNLIRARNSPLAMSGTDVRPHEWPEDVQITIGNTRSGANRWLNPVAGLTVLLNPTAAEVDDLIAEIIADRTALNAT